MSAAVAAQKALPPFFLFPPDPLLQGATLNIFFFRPRRAGFSIKVDCETVRAENGYTAVLRPGSKKKLRASRGKRRSACVIFRLPVLILYGAPYVTSARGARSRATSGFGGSDTCPSGAKTAQKIIVAAGTHLIVEVRGKAVGVRAETLPRMISCLQQPALH